MCVCPLALARAQVASAAVALGEELYPPLDREALEDALTELERRLTVLLLELVGDDRPAASSSSPGAPPPPPNEALLAQQRWEQRADAVRAALGALDANSD